MFGFFPVVTIPSNHMINFAPIFKSFSRHILGYGISWFPVSHFFFFFFFERGLYFLLACVVSDKLAVIIVDCIKCVSLLW